MGFRKLAALTIVLFVVASAAAQNSLRQFESRYYVIHTDLDQQALREFEARISAMAEMYYQRTRGFGGQITKKMPFYLFADPATYYAMGGLPGSAGVFDGDRLMAIVGSGASNAAWHTIQHEGFHQFVFYIIGGDVPIWVNEGLAEYFAQSIYTGDTFIIGIVPPDRLARLKAQIRSGDTKSVAEMMRTSHSQWNTSLNITNYDQAWSMVYFLAHAENGRYQKAFNGFMKNISHGMRWEDAWRKNFGSGTGAFERKWKEYWLSMPDDPSEAQRAEATVATLTSFYARAFSQRQIFQSFDAFAKAAASGQLKSHPSDWLPPSLLDEALQIAAANGKWEIRKRRGYQVVCTLEDGTELVGTFKVRNQRVVSDSIKVKAVAPKKGRRG